MSDVTKILFAITLILSFTGLLLKWRESRPLSRDDDRLGASDR